MERELTRPDALFLAALLDKSLGQFRAFAISDHPAGDVTTEDIEDDVQIVVRPFRGTEPVGDIPPAVLRGSGGHHLLLFVSRMIPLMPALAVFAALLEQ